MLESDRPHKGKGERPEYILQPWGRYDGEQAWAVLERTADSLEIFLTGGAEAGWLEQWKRPKLL